MERDEQLGVDLMENELTQMFGDQSCGAGIKRWNHTMNSEATYKQVVNGRLWNDPVFEGDWTSLYWHNMGRFK